MSGEDMTDYTECNVKPVLVGHFMSGEDMTDYTECNRFRE